MYERQLQDMAPQQHLGFRQMNMHENETSLQVEKTQSSHLANKTACVLRRLKYMSSELRQRNLKHHEISRELCLIKTTLDNIQKRSQEQSAAIISLTELLLCHASHDGGHIDVPRILLERETFREEGIRTQNSFVATGTLSHHFRLDLQEAQKQVASETSRWEARVSDREREKMELMNTLEKCNIWRKHTKA